MRAFEQVHSRVAHRLGRGFAERGLDDVTPAQAGALAVLYELREATTSRLAQRMGLADVTVGRFVAALIRSGYVERRRNPADAREQLLSPTRKAHDRLSDFVAITNEVLDALFRKLDDDGLAALTVGLRQAADRLGGPEATGPRLLPATPPAPTTRR